MDSNKWREILTTAAATVILYHVTVIIGLTGWAAQMSPIWSW